MKYVFFNSPSKNPVADPKWIISEDVILDVSMLLNEYSPSLPLKKSKLRSPLASIPTRAIVVLY